MISAPATGCCACRVCSNRSAGGQEEHPSEVKSSTTTGTRPACAPEVCPFAIHAKAKPTPKRKSTRDFFDVAAERLLIAVTSSTKLMRVRTEKLRNNRPSLVEGALAVKVRDALHHPSLLIFGELRKNGQGQHFFGCTFSLGEISLAVSQIYEARLQMQRDGIINLRPDLARGEELAQFVTPVGPHHVLVKYMVSMRGGLRQLNRRSTLRSPARCYARCGEQPVVRRSTLPPSVVPSSNILQLYSQDGCLDRVETAVRPELFMHVAARAAVVAQTPHMLGHLRLARGYQSSVAVGAKILCGIKTERRGHSHRPCAVTRLIPPARANCLGRILNQRQIKLTGHLLQRAHISALPIKMNRQQRP